MMDDGNSIYQAVALYTESEFISLCTRIIWLYIIFCMKRFQIELGLFATLITITLGLVQLSPISSKLLLLPAAAQQQPAVEIGAPEEKQNEYYIFTQELEANESKLGVPVAVYTLTNIIVHK
jgi:hypothetical protein